MPERVVPANHATIDANFTVGDVTRGRGLSLLAAPLLFVVIAALGLTLASCGGTSSQSKPAASTQTTTAVKHRHVPIVEKVAITSPAFTPDGVLPKRYTCDGANTTPTLRWTGIPPGTAELGLYILKIEPVNKHLLFSWAVAGINPKVHEIKDGKLPPGAVAGLNSSGTTSYSVCPPRHTDEGYAIVLFALPRLQHPQQGFDATTQRIASVRQAEYEGFLVFRYPRH